jgi:hypothetical protein
VAASHKARAVRASRDQGAASPQVSGQGHERLKSASCRAHVNLSLTKTLINLETLD